MLKKPYLPLLLSAVVSLAATSGSQASSHREAPAIAGSPRLDGTDFYMFTSYEPGRENFVTFVANYVPLQDAYGGPNYFELEQNGVYEIEVDNVGDGTEHLTFQFQFTNTPRNLAVPVGGVNVPVPLKNIGPITAGNNGALNVDETYTVKVISGNRRTGNAASVTNLAGGGSVFTKPVDNIGNKSLPNYDAYANQYVYNINIPGSTVPGRMFVGQRKDPFVVNLGETFDLLNITGGGVLGPVYGNKDSLAAKNVTSIILEIPKSFLAPNAAKPTIGAWTTSSRRTGATLTQVSRLANPLVNEVVIGLKDKDTFNASEPKDDGQFATYVTNPSFPALVQVLYGSAGVKAPTLFPRTDLVAVFLQGVTGLNVNGSTEEVMRLNASTPSKPLAQQKNLGALAGDTAGYPNGRRPGDDVVDITLRVAMGALLPLADAPSGQLPFTDGADVSAASFLPAFPYIKTPLAGSPNDLNPYVSFYNYVTKAYPDNQIYYYDPGFKSTIYTSPTLFPNIYNVNTKSYYYFDSATPAGRLFYNYTTGAYETIPATF